MQLLGARLAPKKFIRPKNEAWARFAQFRRYSQHQQASHTVGCWKASQVSLRELAFLYRVGELGHS